jgi:membrane associated rhomboid family serine protease
VLFISMANWAHLFGLLSGMAIAALQLPKTNNG